jgi:hypothetical protein
LNSHILTIFTAVVGVVTEIRLSHWVGQLVHLSENVILQSSGLAGDELGKFLSKAWSSINNNKIAALSKSMSFGG